MNAVSLVLRIVAIIAGIAAGALFFMSQGKLKEKHSQLTSAQSTLATTTTQLNETKAQVVEVSGKLKTSEREAERLSTQLGTARSDLDITRIELNTTKESLNSANSQISGLEERVEKLNVDVQTANDALIAADKTEELAALNEKVAALTTENANIKDELNVASSKLKSYAAGREQNAKPQLSLNTTEAVRSAKLADNVTIASVDSSNGIVVLDAAPDLGLAPGMNVTLIKDLKALGRVRVAKIDNNFAVANILPGTSASRLKAGAVVDILR
ncbi:MAG: hypothetical protein ACPGES_01645 [Coraliomargarita sp.]